MATSVALLRPLTRKTRCRWRDSPNKKEIFAKLDQLLGASGQTGKVGFILSFDWKHKMIVHYRAPQQKIAMADGLIFRILNLSIGQTGTRLNGRIRYSRGAPTTFTRGYFVQVTSDVWAALKNIKANPDEEVIPFSTASGPARR